MSFFPLTPLLRTLFYWLLTSSITIRKPKALWFLILYCCSFAMSNSLWPHGLQHVRLPCPSLCPEFAQTQVHWISDVIQPSHSLSSPSPPAFNLSQHQGLSMSRFFSSGGQRFGASASASVLPVNIQGWFPLGWTGWIFMPGCLPSTGGRILSVSPEFWTFTVMCLCGSFIHYIWHSVWSFHLEIYILQLWGKKKSLGLLLWWFPSFPFCLLILELLNWDMKGCR